MKWLITLLLTVYSLNSMALESQRKIGDWMLIEGVEKGEAYCYAITIPFREKSEADKTSKKEPYIILKKKAQGKISFGVNLMGKIQTNSPVILEVNSKVRNLNPINPSYGWTYSFSDDINLINDMNIDGDFIKVKTTLDTGTYESYFSLKGITKLLNYMQTSCKTGWQGE